MTQVMLLCRQDGTSRPFHYVSLTYLAEVWPLVRDNHAYSLLGFMLAELEGQDVDTSWGVWSFTSRQVMGDE